MSRINNLHLTPVPPTADEGRMLRDAQWWANLAFDQRPVHVYRSTDGLLYMSKETVETAGHFLVATVQPNPFYLSGTREEWRERHMLFGDRRY